MTYDIGDLVHLTAGFVDANGAQADPTTVQLTIKRPTGTDTVTPTNTGIGAYYYDVPITEAGTWTYRWAGTGAVTTAEEGSFTVRQPLSSGTPSPGKTPCERLALAQAQLDAVMSGKSVRAVETPQLGRVEYQSASVTDLHRIIAALKNECAQYLGIAYSPRGPISIEVEP